MDEATIDRLLGAVRATRAAEVEAILSARPELVNTVERWNYEYTALHYAVLQRMPEMVRLLMRHGASARAGISPNNEATTALTMATDRGYEEIAGIIREEEQRREGGKVQETAPVRGRLGTQSTAHVAVISGDAEFLRAEHAAGGLAQPLDEDGGLLRVAVDHDRPEMLLVDLGLDPDARVRVEGVDGTAYTWGMPLYECARQGKHEMAEMLLARGTDPNAQVYASGTPLSEAYGQQDERMIALLERYGGKSNASMAGMYRRKDLALKLLAEHGDTRLADDGFGSGTVAEQLVGAARGAGTRRSCAWGWNGWTGRRETRGGTGRWARRSNSGITGRVRGVTRSGTAAAI